MNNSIKTILEAISENVASCECDYCCHQPAYANEVSPEKLAAFLAKHLPKDTVVKD